MLQDALDLRRVKIISDGSITSTRITSECNYKQVFSHLPEQPEEVPKTMKQIHKKEDMEKMDN